MGDKDAIKQMQERIKKAVGWQARVKALAAPATPEVEETERQERP